MVCQNYGYPETGCNDCSGLGDPERELKASFFRKEKKNGPRLMVVGQDPTIRHDPDGTRVHRALMLDEDNAKIPQWLTTQVFNPEQYKAFDLYATNAVKCRLPNIFSARGGPLPLLRKHFGRCDKYLIKEIICFHPRLVITLGESAHRLFLDILEDKHQSDFKGDMMTDFTGEFRTVRVRGCNCDFAYSPCLHLATWRIASTYGPRIPVFKQSLASWLSPRQGPRPD